MYSYTDMILTIMQRVEVYNEIFKAISKEIQEHNYNQELSKKGHDTYIFCRNNVNRFLMEDEGFRKNLKSVQEKEATKILLTGLDTYKEGIYFLLKSLNEQGEIIDPFKFELGLKEKNSAFKLINQACREACEGIRSAHSVHKM